MLLGVVACSSPVQVVGVPTAGATTASHVAWSKLTPATSPTARAEASMAYDPATSTMVLFGGTKVAGALADTWTWNGTTWTKLTPATSPTARYGASMAYDPATSSVVLFGGTKVGGTFADTWSWNGTTWTKLTPATSPTARTDASMAYDPATGTMVLFGGYGSSGALADTWSWNGTTWTKLTPATSPTARYAATMAYDPATGTMVLFGGYDRSSRLADTWSWNGTTWTKLTPATSPPARTFASEAYVPSLGDLVLFGGRTATGAAADTWTWNGTTWTKLTPATSPTARYGASMAYDTATGAALLFGGGPSGTSLLNDSWSFTTPPGKPPKPTAIAGSARATVSWTAPPATGGRPITGYTATSAPTGKTCTAGATATTCTVAGLRNGTSYTFTVRAKNADGTGPTSTPSTAVTPESTTPGYLTVTCGTAPVATPGSTTTCSSITLGQVDLSGTNQVRTASMHPLYVSTTRGHPTDDWALYAEMVPSSKALTGNVWCQSLQGFCNATTTNATTFQHHLINTSILPSGLTLEGYTCSTDNPATSQYASNPEPTTHPGLAVGNPIGLSQPLLLCTAAAGSSGGDVAVETGTYSLVVPPNVYAGTYYGTVQYTLVPGGVS
ncbi:MAG: Kelch repeat-containing protein [Acidimicrobiales bacterium]